MSEIWHAIDAINLIDLANIDYLFNQHPIKGQHTYNITPQVPGIHKALNDVVKQTRCPGQWDRIIRTNYVKSHPRELKDKGG